MDDLVVEKHGEWGFQNLTETFKDKSCQGVRGQNTILLSKYCQVHVVSSRQRLTVCSHRTRKKVLVYTRRAARMRTTYVTSILSGKF